MAAARGWEQNRGNGAYWGAARWGGRDFYGCFGRDAFILVTGNDNGGR